MPRFVLLFSLLLALFAGRVLVQAAPVQFESIDTSWHAGTSQELYETIDGADVGLHGWFIDSRTEDVQTAIFRNLQPINASAMDITLCFLSGRPNAFFGEFSISVTNDPQPSLSGKWDVLKPLRYTGTGPALKAIDHGRLQAMGKAADAVFQISTRAPSDAPITGFRVDVYPTSVASKVPGLHAAPSANGDFVLTEFRVDAATQRTTNVALGKPVRSSHPLIFSEAFLTDGLPGTFTHPQKPGLGKKFWFEIDLGTPRVIDHIVLRNRGDGSVPERLTRLLIDLYAQPPGDGVVPVWSGHDRADGSHPPVGEVDVVRADDGTGKFEGRWLRISSDSPIAYAPQIAEVEVYEELELQLAGAKGDGQNIGIDGMLRIPAGTRWLTFSLKLASVGWVDDRPCRWRLRGFHPDWQITSSMVAEGVCPPPGNYVFEAQVRHTDREWDETTFSAPIVVHGFFWQSGMFRFLVGAGAVLGLALLVRYLTRRRLARRMARLEAKAALDEERARISRDMHDEVGAQLAQLAILQSMFAREHHLPAPARDSMQQLAQTTRKVVASLDEVVWAVNPKNDSLPSLVAYLEQCATGYLEPVEITCRIDAPFDWPNLEVRAQVRHHLVQAFREALQNILKHSGASEVTLRLRLEGSQFKVLLADNGCGLSGQLDGVGKDGLINMAARLNAVDGECEVRARASGGTEVEMRVHLPLEVIALPG